MRWLAVVVLVAGCDRVWFIDRLPPPTDASDASDASDAVDAALGCPAFFIPSPVTGTSYFYGESAVRWDEARDACRELSVPSATGFVHLAVITDRTEYTIARGVAGTAAWVGIFDPVAGDNNPMYRAVSVEPLPGELPWDVSLGLPDQPDVQTCVRVYMPGGLDDDTCGTPQPYLCECDGLIDNGT
jgi:hypothetical protein